MDHGLLCPFSRAGLVKDVYLADFNIRSQSFKAKYGIFQITATEKGVRLN